MSTRAPAALVAAEVGEADQAFVRRSVRDPNSSFLEKHDVKQLLTRIRENHSDTVVLKIKDNICSDINSVVMDEIISALHKNRVCQALYVQNLGKAIEKKQLRALVELLKKRPIWCLNIGETYHVQKESWRFFCDSLVHTNVTHLYVSEHTIDLDLKNKMRANIRENRKKHDKHCSLKNLRVIEKCTNMWWNPINAIKHQLEAAVNPPGPAPKQQKGQKGLEPLQLTPHHTAYWAKGYGEGGEKAWKFKCLCGEVCSSYENFRYHPVGRMYECTRCSVWSHVNCVLGSHVSDDDIEELTTVLCSWCRTQTRRLKLAELAELNIVWAGGRVVSGGEEALEGEEQRGEGVAGIDHFDATGSAETETGNSDDRSSSANTTADGSTSGSSSSSSSSGHKRTLDESGIDEPSD